MSDVKKDLIERITSILDKLDNDSLKFLGEQADVLLYNMEVRERNGRAAEQNTSIDESKRKGKRDSKIYFEQLKNGKFFNLCIGSEKIFMDYKEVLAILRIAQAAESASEASPRLYNWFKRERKDLLNDASISSSGHPLLSLIYKELLETFETS